MRDLRTTLVQTMLHWEDASANRTMLTEKLRPLKGTTDLVALPEMFSTGFTMRSRELAESMDGPTVMWMREQAHALGAAIYGSLIISAKGKYYNRGIFMRPDGTSIHYDKRHLFRMGEENDHFSAGVDRVIVDWSGWRILLQVCYDLRFPVFSRSRGDHDLMLYSACWPAARRFAWSQLLIARAIENQSCVIGVNRVGMDGKGLHYEGDSVILDPLGKSLTTPLNDGKQVVVSALLDGAGLQELRDKFPIGKDADAFELRH